MQKYDVAIIGGGMVGASLASGLSDSSLRTIVIDRQGLAPEPAAEASPYSSRVSALTEASIELFKHYGAWEKMCQQRTCPYRHMQVWDGEGTGEVHFDADIVGLSHLGYIAENTVIRQTLLEQLATTEVDLIGDQQSFDFECESDGYRINLGNGQKIHTRLLVGADGAESHVRQWAGIPLKREDCLHRALVTTVETENYHQDTAWQVFLDSGPLAFLPLPDQDGRHFCSIVWSLLPEQANRMMSLDESGFCQTLERNFEARLGKLKLVDQRYRYPLQHRHALQYYRSGIVLIGDSAHTIHPLAGQGVNLGLQDVEVLTGELLRAHRRGDDIGADHVLQRYQRRRKGANLAMQTAMNAFQHLFNADDLAIRWLRNAGMNFTNHSPILKQQLIARAMGLQI